MYIKRNDFDTFEELEDFGKEWEIELKKSEIKGQILQITEPRRESSENQDSQNRKQQNIPTVPWRRQRYNKPQYQTPYVQRPNPYPAILNTPQPKFWQEFQPGFRNNKSRFQYNTYDQLIPRMNHLTLNRVPDQTQPTIEFPTENRESPAENTQQNSQKQFANNVNRNQESRIWNNKIQDNPNWLRQGTQMQNANASENSIQLNCYNCKEPGHFKRKCSYLSQNQGN